MKMTRKCFHLLYRNFLKVLIKYTGFGFYSQRLSVASYRFIGTNQMKRNNEMEIRCSFRLLKWGPI